MFIKNVESRTVLSIFRRALLLVPKAAAVPVLYLEHDKASRTASITFRLEFDDGTSITSADYPPFIIPVGE